MAVEPGSHGRWSSPCVLTGAGAMVSGAAMAVGSVSDPLAGLFFAGGAFMVLIDTFGSRLLKGTFDLGAAGKFQFELAQAQEAREITTSAAATEGPTTDGAEVLVPEMEPGVSGEPAQAEPEAGNEEDDLTRWLLADTLLQELFLRPNPDLQDCRFQLYLFDPDLELLLPILEPGHPGRSPGFEPGQGAVGEAWSSGDYVVATGLAVRDDTFGLSQEQQERYQDVSVAAALPITNGAGRTIGVVSGSSKHDNSTLDTDDGFAALVFLAEAAARVLIDLLKWFSDGYDTEGGRETRWSAR